jgi:hypothetical protein
VHNRQNSGVAAAGVEPRPQAIVDLDVVLRRYGFLGLDASASAPGDDGWIECRIKGREAGAPVRCMIAHAAGADAESPPGGFLYDPRRASWFRKPVPAYRALLPHRTLNAASLDVVLSDERGRPVVAWDRNARTLWVGLRVSDEMTRYVQGDPRQVDSTGSRARFGFSWERPNYLYEAQVVEGLETEPWADRLGFLLAEELAREAGLPLLEPIPHAGFGAVVITGDDDQALLERYARQLEVLDGLPITYYMHILTKHTSQTLAALPSNVDYGVHPDALDTPERYDALCSEQTEQIRRLCGRPARTVRNHGFLNDGYWGHLPAWERSGLMLDLNTPGVSGTALTGSLLPFRVRRAQGGWSDHFSALTMFGDGMQEALKWTARQAAARVKAVTRQIERRFPALVVINLHPMNIITTEPLHREVAALCRRRGWRALWAEQLLDWLLAFETIELETRNDGGVTLTSAATVRDLAIRIATPRGWQRTDLPEWSRTYQL